MARTPKIVEDRREQILDAALRVFAHKGFHRATNKDIAREAGITAGLIYHYFDNKEAVLTSLVEERSPLGLLRSLPTEFFSLPPERFFRLLITQILAFVESEQFTQIIRIFLPELIYSTELASLVASTFLQATAFPEKYIAARVATGELRQVDPTISAQILISCIVGMVLRRQILRDPVMLSYSQEQLVEAIVSTACQSMFPLP
ncbi:TetR/AcrR family transcriptional regulator [Tengunoibacter tsumagoiensis]|uniref:TetR family transcriptional regulator n=1 Tax=Tengunoibacter tsumagoiensis TaxID=2014871 RepID=A0A401ZWT6_9CHLR|nr:TetR/AcrR family transcriptional regulator [Tengunoibacter tsumagoiensis]GCE11328.1 TetR family transcriptional regulator [Tengunoibacter tsumagoiensis]